MFFYWSDEIMFKKLKESSEKLYEEFPPIARQNYGFGYPIDHYDLMNNMLDDSEKFFKSKLKFIPYLIISLSLSATPIFARDLNVDNSYKEIPVIRNMHDKYVDRENIYNNVDAVIFKTPMDDFKEKFKSLESRLWSLICIISYFLFLIFYFLFFIFCFLFSKE